MGQGGDYISPTVGDPKYVERVESHDQGLDDVCGRNVVRSVGKGALSSCLRAVRERQAGGSGSLSNVANMHERGQAQLTELQRTVLEDETASVPRYPGSRFKRGRIDPACGITLSYGFKRTFARPCHEEPRTGRGC